MVRTLTAGLLLLLSFMAGAQTPNAPSGFVASSNPLALSVSGLHVSGNRILNGLGQAVTLRGVDKSGTEYMCLGPTSTAVFDGPSDASDITNLLSWGVNVVRLPINEQCWLGINGLPIALYTATAYQNAIIAYVNLLTAANIATIIDLQWAAPGTNQAYPSPQALIPMPDADHAPTFWTSAANTFKTNSSVIFDLFNEPFPDNNGDTTAAWTCLRDGCTSVYPNDSSNYTSVGMQSLVNTIRATGAANVIMSPGVQFTNSISQWLTYRPTDSANNLVAAEHLYAGQSCSSLSCYDANIAPVLASFPVIMGEIGENDCQHTPFIDPTMVWLDAHYAHYLAWAWNTNDCSGFPSLLSAYDGTPTSFGVGVRDRLLALRGSTPPAPPVVPLFTNTYPFGIAVGSSTDYTAVDGTVYHADVATTGLALDMQFFPTYSAVRSISGTSDPTLYQHGRYGQFGTWDIGVLNGTYQITLSIAPATAFTQSTVNDPSTASINNAGEFGQDQNIQGQIGIRGCIWSQYANGTNSPFSTPATSCPAAGGAAAPAVDTVSMVTYTIDVTNQKLSIEPQASFGGNRKTMLNAIKVAQQSTPSIPSTPTGLGATGGNAVVNLSWTTTSGATTYNVFRATTSRGFYRLIAAPATNSYADTAVVNGRTYYYIISAANVAGTSAKTSSVNATPALPIPSTPTGVGASPGNTQVVVSWTASAGATSYHVKRSTTSGSGYTTVGSPTSSPFTDTGRTNGTTYYYVVSALNASGESANSSEVNATPSTGGGTGVWADVTPGGISLDPTLCSNGNFGIETVGADTAHPGTLYFNAHCQGIYKSTDYGQTWTGPINTGTNGSSITSCQGGMTVVSTGSTPIIYQSCIRGAPGLWKSTDGGVNWTSITLVPPLPSGRPDVYPVSVDPYNVNHVLAMGHEQNFLLESTDGGSTWSSKTMPTSPSGGTAFAFFIDTGNSTTTAQTWLWIAQQSGGGDGAWRTTNGATSWTRVDNNEHPHGDSQIFQPDTSGVVFMAGNYSALGNGVLRSTDYGATWAHVGNNGNEALVWGTSSHLYAMYGWSTNTPVDPSFESAATPGTGTWTFPASGAPSTFNGGPHQIATVNDGTHNIFLGAMGLGGLWRYIEP